MNEESKAGSYKDLLVWQKGIALVKLAYRLTQAFPGEERFGLVSQMRRAAVSIPSNIAEGQARHTTGEFIQFISYAEGSAAELDTQFVLAVELGYCKPAEAEAAFALILELRKNAQCAAPKSYAKTWRLTSIAHHLSLLAHHCFYDA